MKRQIPLWFTAFVFTLLSVGLAHAQVPTISSFSPTSGNIGTSVTITGTNFNATPTNNVVFFGATRATVTAATATSVTVTVPTSATYAPITLLNTGTSLAAYSLSNFTPTYSPIKTTITATDFQTKQDFATGTQPYSVAMGDLDGDGKPDLAVANNGSGTVSVYRNTTTSGSIGTGSFDAKVDFAMGTNPRSVAIGDFNGDGKPDLAVVNQSSNNVSVIRNKSTIGSIDFYAKVDFTTGTQPQSVAVGDLDGDGKPDLAVANQGSSNVSVIRNKSTSGSIDFYAKVDFATGGTNPNPRSVAIGDLDGDGKPDLAVANNASNTVSVIRNKSTIGSIDFYAKVDFATGSAPFSVAIGDLDGDGKPDLAVANLNEKTVSVIRNKSTSGSIDFDAKVDFTTGNVPISVAIGDLDGDGKPDLAVANQGSGNVSVIRNKSTSGIIDFYAKVDFATGTQSISVAIGDLDGDGRPDLAVANYGSTTVSVLRNADISPPLTITPPGSLVVCSPSTLTLTASGCAGTVTWSQGAATGTSLTLSAVGTYSITATCTDAGVTSAASTAVTGLQIKATVSVTAASQTNISCNGGSNGAASINTPTGGAGGYTYSWSPSGGTATTATGLSAGTYTVTVTGANSCTATQSFTITQPTAISTSTAAQTNVSCNGGSNGSASVTPSGGAGGYTYSWSPSGGTAATATGLSAGTYTVTVTDANACTATRNFTITQPTAITVTAASQTNIACNGGSNGAASINTPTGGAGGYTYSWSPSGGTAATATGLSAGTYTVTVTDANACTATRNFTITQPTAISTATAAQTNVSCNGGSNGSATVTPSGGTGGYTYSWSPSGGTAATATGLSAGTYTVTVSDANACTATRNFTITQPPIVTAPIITPPVSLVVCSPSSLTLIASGCAGTVTWSEGAATGTSLTLSTIGTYSITAICTDNGCISNASTAVTGLEIKAKPSAPTVTAPTEKVVCFPSTLTLTASPCAGTVTWSQGAATGSSLTLSTVGTYSITATCTVNGCTSDASNAVTGLEIKAKPNLTVNAPTEKVVCFPSTLTLTASGCAGTVAWSNAATGSSLTLSTVGTYSITATCTVNGCTSDPSTAVTGLEIKAKPNAPTVNAPTEKVVCFPSTLTLTASGCEGTVTWSNAATGTSLPLSVVDTYSISATCTVNGCISDASIAVTGLEIKAQPIISSSNTGPYTIGQIISLNGTGTGTYIWTGPNNFTSTLSNPTINNALSVNAGVYTLTVTGLNSCINTSTTNVVVNEIDPCDPTRIVDYFYVKAGNPYQTLFQLTDGMVINQMRDQVSILANPVCSSVTIESMEMNIQGPELNWNVLQNVPPNALFDNRGLDFFGRNFNPGNYTLTVTGYARDNKGGGITYGPKVIRFTVVGNLATINAPTLSKTSICAGSSVDVTFATSGTFNDINQYLIELSDTSGSFEKPLLIGTTNVTGTTTCLIPQNTVGGSKYLIRVVSSNQVVVSNPVISQVTVNPLNYSLVSPTNNLTGASTKKAVDSISASNKITSPANVVYEAGKSVLLTPGFESGAVFRAEVKSCDN